MNMMKDIFTNIIKYRKWDHNIPCGSGSSLGYTEQLRKTLPAFLIKHRIQSMADMPCGDFSWMSQVEFPENFYYIGGDIVNFLIRKNQRKWPEKDFKVSMMISIRMLIYYFVAIVYFICQSPT